MGNLSKTKKRRLSRVVKQAKARKQQDQMEAQVEFASKQQALMERPVAAVVRHICQEMPHLMLGWSYPKAPRDGFNYLTVQSPAGDTMYIYGAPYRRKPEGITGVKMAEEIDLPCDIDIPTADFNVPDMEDFQSGMNRAMEVLLKKGEIFIGCMGGIGRTGLAIAGLLKLHDQHFQGGVRPATSYRDHIRKYVHPHAIETKQQLDFIDQYQP